MQVLDNLRASDGTGNAVLGHVTILRTAGATVLKVDSVSKWNVASFIGTTGTLGSDGYVVPASVTEFVGHVTAGDIIIDSFEAGSTDLGNAVGQVVICKQTTGWANRVNTGLQELQTEDQVRAVEGIFDYILAPTGIWSGLGYGSTLTAAMTAATVYQGGIRGTVAAVATRTFTASKDTYVDILRAGTATTPTFTLVYTEVANNAVSPALAANSVRMAIIVTGATFIINVGSINQGEENKILPIAASAAYSVVDSLGNLICPRDPSRKILGYRQLYTDATTANSTDTAVPALSCPVIVPIGRKIRVTVRTGGFYNGTASARSDLTIWDGTVASGTLLGRTWGGQALGGGTWGAHATARTTPSSANKTYNVGIASGSGGGTTTLSTTALPVYLEIELL